tara:strand:- start:211 stop:561 length:351 start_codon:yes stop_codon:yes gene_type:complete
MDKESLVGKDALVGKDQRTLLLGLVCPTAVPGRGSEVFDGDKVVAEMTAGADSPALGQGIGYARFKSPGDWAGRALSVRLPDQTVHECNIVDLPFFDAEKRLPRGLAEVPDGATGV